MRVARDGNFDSQRTSTKQEIPITNGIPSALGPGDLFFDQNTKLLYCSGNKGIASASSRVISTINTGVNPAGIAITPDGKKAYVANNANYGDYTITTPPQNINNITVIDLETFLPLTTISDSSFNGAYTITINSAGTKAYVTNSGGSTISIIDTATDTVTGTIIGLDGPSGFVISPGGTRAYANNYGATPGAGSGNGNSISVIDMTQNIPIIISTITLTGGPPAAAPAAITISPDGLFVYTINYVDGNPGTGYITKIRTSDNSIIPFLSSGLSGPFAIKITPDGTKAVITNFGSNNFVPFGTSVSIVDLSTASISNISGGIQPSGLDITSDGKYAYFTNYNTLYGFVSNQLPNPQTIPPTTLPNFAFNNQTAGQGTVNIIDLSTNKIISPTIAVGQSPANLTISPDGSFALVSCYTSNTITVISV
jgi:YVTN family beta-propeller protein